METTKITIIVDDQLSLLTKFCHLKRLRWSKCRSEHSKWLCLLFVDQFHSYIICRMTIHRSIDRSSSISLFQKSLYADFEGATFFLSLHLRYLPSRTKVQCVKSVNIGCSSAELTTPHRFVHISFHLSNRSLHRMHRDNYRIVPLSS